MWNAQLRPELARPRSHPGRPAGQVIGVKLPRPRRARIGAIGPYATFYLYRSGLTPRSKSVPLLALTMQRPDYSVLGSAPLMCELDSRAVPTPSLRADVQKSGFKA